MKTTKLLMVVLLAAVLVACGGGSAGNQAPVDVVKSAWQAIEKMDIDAAQQYVCQAQREEFAQEFDLSGGFGELVGAGDADVDTEAILDAMQINMEDMEYEEISQEGDEAVVNVQGTMKIDFDTDKLKAVMKDAMAASGESVSDEELDMALGMMEGMLGAGVPLDEEMTLIKEDGKWVICD